MENIVLESHILNDKYTDYVYTNYDIQDREKTVVNIPLMDFNEISDFKWNIGVIIGESGSGKTTLLKRLGEPKNTLYDEAKSCVSQFPNLSEQEVSELFNSVGFSSIPTWLRKPHELSNGERARLDLCYSIVNTPKDEIILLDEFSSVIDRFSSKSMSFALQRYLRKNDRKAIIASCHYDIIEEGWLMPDWIYNLNKNVNNEVHFEKMIYSDDAEYENYLKIDHKDILTTTFRL